MPPPRSTMWPIEPHTQVKHLILRTYLGAWLPIMARHNDRLVYIDGFAGPGRYEGGEEGSPLIAIKAILDHPSFQNRTRAAEVVFLFVEKDNDRYEALQQELQALRQERRFPQWVKCEVRLGEFHDVVGVLLDSLDHQSLQLAPTFAFIDPFGYKGLPLQLISRIVKNPRCECLINFMYEAFTRHADKEHVQAEFDALFWTIEWREILKESDPRERYHRAVDLYRRQLIKKGGVKYVRTFAMFDKSNQPEYVLFFGTSSPKGLSVMKNAMWKADRLGGQVFSDWTDTNQTVLFDLGKEQGLRYELQKQFREKGFVQIGELIHFVLFETAYSETSHLKAKTLAPMEKEGLIEVQGGPSRRKYTYPDGTKVRFR